MNSTADQQNNWLSSIKEKFKAYPGLYAFLIDIISPVCPNRKYKLLLKSLPEEAIVVNLGSGPFRLAKSIINVDITRYREVDIVADVIRLPFADNSIDGIISIALLEHVLTPDAVVEEIERVLKPGGLVFCLIPFMQGYHASPHDYYRWTRSGIEELFRDFKPIKIGISAGPTSSLLWILQEWLATLFSFNIQILYKLLLLGFMVLTFPFKWLDLVLNRYQIAINIASSFYFYGALENRAKLFEKKSLIKPFTKA